MGLRNIIEVHLISAGELARTSGLAESTIRRLLTNSNEPRVTTKSRVLDGLNKILRDKGEKAVKANEVFGKKHD
jgi:DNA-binding phage protein